MTVSVSMTHARHLEQDDKLDAAAKAYGDILARFPEHTDARHALETLRERMANIDEPPTEVLSQIRAQFDAEQFSAAASQCARELNTYRKSYVLWATLGHCHLKRGMLDEAATCLNKAMELDPAQADVFALMAQVNHRQGHETNAIALYRKALQRTPDHLVSLQELGKLLLRRETSAEGIAHLKSACALAPNDAKAHYSLATALRRSGQLNEARASYEAAVAADPDMTAARYNLGHMLTLEGQHQDALRQFDQICATEPHNDRARASKFYTMAQLCNWEWRSEYERQRRHLGLQGTPCQPQHMMALEDNPDLLRLRTQAYAAQIFQNVDPLAPSEPRDRLRVGYVVSDLNSPLHHPLINSVFAQHDRSKFEVFVYTYGPGAAETPGLVDAVDHLHDLHGKGDTEVVAHMRRDALDIAIDLNGFDGATRSELFGYRLAPLQMSYLGYPGTMGCTLYDYLIGDAQTCPPGSERFFDEFLIRMPHSYLVTDRTPALTDHKITRSDCGLPETGLVFCAFAENYKIASEEFDIWMDLLRDVPNSVLWLHDSGNIANQNLKDAATARHISEDRLVFAHALPPAESLARLGLADLFLDSFTINACHIARDALWAGVPVVTCAGKQFSARIGASLLSAIGLQELITTSPGAYKHKLLTLAQDDAARRAVTARLIQNRDICALFDTAGMVRDLELALETCAKRQQQGQFADHLDIAKLKENSPRAATA